MEEQVKDRRTEDGGRRAEHRTWEGEKVGTWAEDTKYKTQKTNHENTKERKHEIEINSKFQAPKYK
jgi:hypothetical protein